jgi:hypothetical protein
MERRRDLIKSYHTEQEASRFADPLGGRMGGNSPASSLGYNNCNVTNREAPMLRAAIFSAGILAAVQCVAAYGWTIRLKYGR